MYSLLNVWKSSTNVPYINIVFSVYSFSNSLILNVSSFIISITLPSQPTKVVIQINDKIKCFDKDNQIIEVEVIELIYICLN
jgi:hypothetical protein